MSRKFDGVDDIIDIPSGVIDGTGTLRMSFLIDSLPSAGSSGILIENMGNNAKGLALILNAGGDLDVRFGAPSGAQRDVLLEVSSLTTGVWHNLAASQKFSFDLGAQISYLFINGVLEDESQKHHVPGGQTTDNSTFLGARDEAGTQTNFFDGKIAHAQFNQTLCTRGECLQLTRFPGSITREMIFYLPLWGFSAPEPDYTSNQNHGVVDGAIFSGDNPPINGIFRPRRSEWQYAIPAAAPASATLDQSFVFTSF